MVDAGMWDCLATANPQPCHTHSRHDPTVANTLSIAPSHKVEPHESTLHTVGTQWPKHYSLNSGPSLDTQLSPVLVSQTHQDIRWYKELTQQRPGASCSNTTHIHLLH